jgi:hypothetical protein
MFTSGDGSGGTNLSQKKKKRVSFFVGQSDSISIADSAEEPEDTITNSKQASSEKKA